LLRALVACGWFGIQTWIGGWAIYKILAVWWPALDTLPPAVAGLSWPKLACFLAFWGLHVVVVWRGIETIRFLLNLKVPLLILMGLVLLAWAYDGAGGFGPILARPSQFEAGGPKEGRFWVFFFPALAAMVGSWATLSLNIPDFTRYAASQRDQAVGQ